MSGWPRATASGAKRVVTLDWRPRPDGLLPGIDVMNERIAASAVDFVVVQLHRNERGVPEQPTSLPVERGGDARRLTFSLSGEGPGRAERRGAGASGRARL